MNCFNYRGRKENGAVVTGKLWAESVEEVKLQLRHEAILVCEINADTEKSRMRQECHKWRLKEISKFSLLMSQLLASGIGLKQILEIVAQQHRQPRYRELQMRIGKGERMSDVLAGFGFPVIATTLVQAGENSGLLSEAFHDIFIYYERLRSWRGKFYQASVYPLIVILLSVFFFLGAVLVILPTFEQVFLSLQVELPPLTAALLYMGKTIREDSIVIFFAALGLMAIGRVLYAQRVIRFFLARIFWRIASKRIYGFYCYARVCRVWGVLLRSGVPLMETLDLIVPLWGNSYAKFLQKEVKERLLEGGGLCESYKAVHLGTAYFHNMIHLGEVSGGLDEALLQCAGFYDSQVDTYMNGIQQVLEPILISVVGIGVAVLVLAIMMPLFETISAVSHV